MSKRVLLAGFFLAVSLAFVQPAFVQLAFAQSDRATPDYRHRFRIRRAGWISSVPVQAKNSATGVVYDGATSTTGNYTISQLPVGGYEISVAAPGFKKYTRAGLTVRSKAQVPSGGHHSRTGRVDGIRHRYSSRVPVEHGDRRRSARRSRGSAGRASSAWNRRQPSWQRRHTQPQRHGEPDPGHVLYRKLRGPGEWRSGCTQSFRIDGQDAHPTPARPAWPRKPSRAWTQSRRSLFKPAIMPRNTGKWAVGCSMSP